MLICSFLDLGNGEMNEVLESGWQHLTSCHNLILRYENISKRDRLDKMGESDWESTKIDFFSSKIVTCISNFEI